MQSISRATEEYPRLNFKTCFQQFPCLSYGQTNVSGLKRPQHTKGKAQLEDTPPIYTREMPGYLQEKGILQFSLHVD